jgi:anti-sigma B factor antagonist
MGRMAHRHDRGEDECGPEPVAAAAFVLDRVHECAVVRASGEVDICTSPALREALQNAASAADRIVVDLTAVTFLDSTGIGVLLHALKQDHHRERGTLCLVGPTGMVRKVLNITQISQVLPIYVSVEEAVHQLA